MVQAQDSQPATPGKPQTRTLKNLRTPLSLKHLKKALERAGTEAIQGVEAAGEAVPPSKIFRDAAQDASRAAQEAISSRSG